MMDLLGVTFCIHLITSVTHAQGPGVFRPGLPMRRFPFARPVPLRPGFGMGPFPGAGGIGPFPGAGFGRFPRRFGGLPGIRGPIGPGFGVGTLRPGFGMRPGIVGRGTTFGTGTGLVGTGFGGRGVIGAGPGIIGAGPGAIGAGTGIFGAGPGAIGAGTGFFGAGPGVMGAGSGIFGRGPFVGPTPGVGMPSGTGGFSFESMCTRVSGDCSGGGTCPAGSVCTMEPATGRGVCCRDETAATSPCTDPLLVPGDGSRELRTCTPRQQCPSCYDCSAMTGSSEIGGGVGLCCPVTSGVCGASRGASTTSVGTGTGVVDGTGSSTGGGGITFGGIHDHGAGAAGAGVDMTGGTGVGMTGGAGIDLTGGAEIDLAGRAGIDLSGGVGATGVDVTSGGALPTPTGTATADSIGMSKLPTLPSTGIDAGRIDRRPIGDTGSAGVGIPPATGAAAGTRCPGDIPAFGRCNRFMNCRIGMECVETTTEVGICCPPVPIRPGGPALSSSSTGSTACPPQRMLRCATAGRDQCRDVFDCPAPRVCCRPFGFCRTQCIMPYTGRL